MVFVARPVRNEELGKFLLSRRQRMSAESCGLWTLSRRRTPGLRREEVSWIAGISTAYYTWIEQGRPFDISADVLYSVAGALRLSEVETSYVFALAGKAELRPRPPEPLSSAGIMQLVSSFESGPALALTPWLDVLGGNAQARELFKYEAGMNLASWFFRTGATDAKPCKSDEIAVALVALLRRNRAREEDTGRVGEIIERLRSESRDFALLWDGQIVDSPPMVEVEFECRGGRETYQTMLLCDSVASRQYALFMTPLATRQRAPEPMATL